jgi:4-amino-4-deoxy-L-arabinose transferase-like glycosyltransferase
MAAPSDHRADLTPPTVEAWLARHPRRVTAALVGAALFVRLILFLQVGAGPLPRFHELIVDSDNHFFDAWGKHLAGGDWLQPAPLHPMTAWMRQVADDAVSMDPQLPKRLGLAPDLERPAMEEKLWDHWLGGASYYQEPAYPYLVGLTYLLTGANPWHVYAWQLALGVAGVLLVHALARRLFSETAAAAAGALAVLAPSPLFYEVTLLRDGPIAVVTLALAWAMRWAVAGGRRRWLLLGLAFGAATLLKQTFVLFPVCMGLWRLVAVRARLRDRLIAAGLVGAGLGAALLPAVLRNLAVGAPPLALTGAGSAMLAAYHTASASPFDLNIGPEFPGVLVRAGGRLLASLLEAAETHVHRWGMPLLELEKLLYVWHGFESPNNVDFYVFRQGAPLLAALPVTFVVLLPLAGIGLASRRAADAWPVLVAVLATIPAMVLAAVFARYRASLSAALLPLAGAGLVRLASWSIARRWLRLAAAAGTAALYLGWATASPPGKEPAARARRYALIGAQAVLHGEPEAAVLHLQESLRLAPGEPRVEARLGQALLESGQPQSALPHVEAAARSLDSSAFRELHARALAAVGRHEEALAEARAALSADPRAARARELVERLERRSNPTTGVESRPEQRPRPPEAASP